MCVCVHPSVPGNVLGGCPVSLSLCVCTCGNVYGEGVCVSVVGIDLRNLSLSAPTSSIPSFHCREQRAMMSLRKKLTSRYHKHFSQVILQPRICKCILRNALAHFPSHPLTDAIGTIEAYRKDVVLSRLCAQGNQSHSASTGLRKERRS
jgi:hypothetical protein